MKNLTQTIFLACLCMSAIAQSSWKKSHVAQFLLKGNAVQETSALAVKTVTMPCLKDSIIRKSWNSSTNTWYGGQKSVFGYDTHFNNTSELIYNYSTFDQAWTLVVKRTLTYDSRNNLISNLYQSWNSSANTFMNNSVYETTYNSNNLPLVETNKTINSQTNLWEINSTNSYTYTGLNPTVILYRNINMQTHILENTEKITITYDIFNNPLMATIVDWNTPTNSWVNAYEVTVTNSGSQPLQYLYKAWDPASNSYKNEEKVTMSYTNNDKVLEIDQQWNSMTNAWENTYRNTYTYDAKHNQLSNLSEEWDHISVWEKDYKSTFAYDARNNQVAETSQIWSNTTWLNASDSRMYYNCTTVGLEELSSKNNFVKIYPNPAHSEIFIETTVDLKSVRIINLSGQIVLNRMASEKILIADLKAGIYFIQLLDKNGKALQTEKFIKE